MKLAHLFFNVNMSLGHNGLVLLMGKKRKKLQSKEECALFVNTAFTSVKLMTFDTSFVAYFKKSSGQLDPATIRYLPEFLEGGEIKYNAALKKVIDKHFKKRENK
jgi:hypothetical protein